MLNERKGEGGGEGQQREMERESEKAKEKAADEGKAPRRRCQDERAKTMMMMWMS